MIQKQMKPRNRLSRPNTEGGFVVFCDKVDENSEKFG